MRREVLTWDDVDKLIDYLIPQFDVEFEGMVVITRGGIIPGGLLSESLNIRDILTASVDFPVEMEVEKKRLSKSPLLAWPKFLQFPDDALLEGRRILVVDDVWGSGRTITAVKNRVTGAGGFPNTCVMHFNPYRNRFDNSRPDFFAAITDAHIVYPWEMPRGPEVAWLNDIHSS